MAQASSRRGFSGLGLRAEQAPLRLRIVAMIAVLLAGALTATGLAASARDKVSSNSGPDESRVDELHPDSTARQDDPYPQGNLP